jgi:hypothetical protein
MMGYDLYDIYHCPFIHDNRNYNQIVYGDQKINDKKYNSVYYEEKDNDLYHEFAKAWLYNEKSLLKIKNAKRNIKDFWKEIGLENSFYKIKEKYDKISIEKGEKNE